ncbi:MAG: glycosyltransferase family 4 protein [Bacteroidota bacterium]
MNDLHLCFILDSYPPAIGGAETALQNICEGLAQRNFDVTVITAWFGGNEPVIEKSEGLTVVRLRIPRLLRRFWFVQQAIPAILRYARNSDIVVGSTYGGVLPAFLGSILLKKKRVMMVHEVMRHRWFRFEKNPLKAFFYYLTEKILIRLPFQRVVAVSEYTRNELLHMGMNDEAIDVIYHGMPDGGARPIRNRDEVRTSLGFGKGDFLYLAFGRLGVTKGFQYLARAIPEIIRQVPQARFLLIFFDYDRRIRREIGEALVKVTSNSYKLFDSVPRELLIDYIHAADCVVIPSLSEGFGFAALEACAAGTPLVATKAGALPEVVYGRHVLVEPASVEQLSEGCRRVFEGRTLYSEPKDFRWETSIEKWEIMFRSL